MFRWPGTADPLILTLAEDGEAAHPGDTAGMDAEAEGEKSTINLLRLIIYLFIFPKTPGTIEEFNCSLVHWTT